MGKLSHCNELLLQASTALQLECMEVTGIGYSL